MENIHSKLHIALIMDDRWASKNGIGRSKGHHGCLEYAQIARKIYLILFSTITAYAFSTENWNRSIKEIYWLFRLVRNFLINIPKHINLWF